MRRKDGPSLLTCRLMDLVEVWTTCTANDIQLDRSQLELLERYHHDLEYWNEKVNMVSRADIIRLWERHIIHSLLLLKYVSFKQKARVLDVGTGGGLPGLPLKIARQDLLITLVDSIAKKATMVRMFAQHTELKDIVVLAQRVEALQQQPHYRASFDVIVSRAVAPTATLLTWTQGLLAPKGQYAFLKGGDISEELDEARRQFPKMYIEEHALEALGLPWLVEDHKKVVLCRPV